MTALRLWTSVDPDCIHIIQNYLLPDSDKVESDFNKVLFEMLLGYPNKIKPGVPFANEREIDRFRVWINYNKKHPMPKGKFNRLIACTG